MADNSLPKVPERNLDLVTYEQVKEIRVVDTSDNSKTLAINNLTIAGTKVTVAVDGLSGTVDGAFGDVLTAIAEKADTTQVEALDAEKVDKTQSVIAGAGMTGGGALAGNVTLNVITADDSLVVAADNIKVNTVDALTSDSATRPLSAKQGKALNLAKVGLTGNETIAGVKTFSSSPIVPTPTTDMQASTKKYGDDILAAYGVDINNVCGAVNHYKRVLADAGGVLDRTQLLKVYTEYIKQRTETVRLYLPEVGAKLRTSGLNRYGVKAYDLSANQKDAGQATEGTQPYMTVGAAPNARLGMRFVQGQTQTGLLDFTDVAFAATDSWTLTVVVKTNKDNCILYLSGIPFLFIGTTSISLRGNSDSSILSASTTNKIGKTLIIEFQYSNGTGLIKCNGVPLTTTVISQAITFGYLSTSLSPIYYFDGTIYSFHLTNTRKSAYQSQLDHQFLSTLFPDMESVTIGNQVWATSNFEGTVAGDGTVIPEVQSSETAADATNIYNSVYAATTGSAAVKDLAATKAAAMWCHYDNLAANGAVYGKLYNWYAVHLFDLYPPVKGWRIPSKADFDQLVAVNGGATVAGGKLKAKFGVFDNAFANNESGFSAISSGQRITGSFGGIDSIYSIRAKGGERMWVISNTNVATVTGIEAFERMYAIRLLRNEPAGANELSYTSGLFTTDITSAAKQIPISFGRMVDAIRIKSENALTAIEAKLHNAAGTAVATLITGKTMNAGETKMFAVSADWVSLLQDGTVRVTAAGNSGAAVGMEIEVLTHKGVLS